MTPPLVSIVIPSFQQARFVRVAIDSVLSQDYAPIEVLVCDGGSTDGTIEILQSYGDRITFESRRDGGQCDAINTGFRRSRGEVVAWLNSDDFYYPHAVRNAVEALQADREAALVYGEGNLVDENGEVLRRFPETVPFDLWRLMHVADYILQPTVFFRRAALFESGLLDESLHWGLDWDLWMRLGARRRFAYVDSVLAAGRLHGDTKTSTGGMRRLRELLSILRRHGVHGWSPAGVAHTSTTVARRCGLIAEEAPAVRGDAPASPRMARMVRRPVATAERVLRRWLENAQGVWRDGYVGGLGHLWLPDDGRATRLTVRGRNLDVQGQVVGVRCGGRDVRSGLLAPGEEFELAIAVDGGRSPVKAVLSCARTTKVAPLEPRLGPRRAGWLLQARELCAG